MASQALSVPQPPIFAQSLTYILMLTSLRIQNFRSIRDASVKLGQVNLFIGPNNSGKSNFLKGIEVLAGIFQGSSREIPAVLANFESLVRRAHNEPSDITKQFIKYELYSTRVDALFVALGFHQLPQYKPYDFEPEIPEPFNNIKKSRPYEDPDILNRILASTKSLLLNVSVFKPDPAAFSLTSSISLGATIDKNGENIVSFIFNLSQNHKEEYKALERDFEQCVGNLVSFATPLYIVEPNAFRLKFFDKDNIDYWAEDVSEGVLYFLAFLCIIHQPFPPKVLLLEEPEKGIHPRRIKEIMGFIFELARLRDIQIILTSHSPYVVDHFADIPECISVFDRKDGETVIHNAADIIKETNDKLEAAGQKPIRYTDALGEYWVSGFLGGVPL